MKYIFLFVVLFISPLYAVFEVFCPFSSDENVRVISDENKFGVGVKRNKGLKYKYSIDVVCFEGLKITNIKFEDDVCYEVCYFPKNGDYLFFVSTPLEKAFVIIVNRNSGEVIKYNLDVFLEKEGLYKKEDLFAANRSFSLNFWHDNHWKTIGSKVFLLCGKNNNNVLIFMPFEQNIYFENKLIKGIEREVVKRKMKNRTIK